MSHRNTFFLVCLKPFVENSAAPEVFLGKFPVAKLRQINRSHLVSISIHPGQDHLFEFFL